MDRSGFGELDAARLETWGRFPTVEWADEHFLSIVGLEMVELRDGWAKMHLPFRAANTQPAGVIHGGVIATIIDSVVVPIIGSRVPAGSRWSTIELHTQFHRPLAGDATVVGWIVKQGRSIVFTRAEVFDGDDALVASGTATYSVKTPEG